MLKLINIIQKDNLIEADYEPENSGKTGHIVFNPSTEEWSAELVDDYGAKYEIMALNGLIRTIEELKSGKIKEAPKERLVMWY